MKTKLINLLAVVCLALSACTMPGSGGETGSGAYTVWIDQPLSGATVPLGPFALKAHAQNTDGSVQAIEFEVNGILLGSMPVDGSLPLVYAEFEWNPSVPGMAEVRAVAVRGGQRDPSAAAQVCVSGMVKTASLGIEAADCGDEGTAAAQPPEEKPTEVTPSALTLDFKFGASPDPVYYGACASEPQTLNFEAVLYDTQTGNPVASSQVSSVNMHYVIQNTGGARGEFLLNLPDASGGLYRNSLNINDKALSTLGSGNGIIEYWVEVLDTGGGTAASPHLTVNLMNCGQQAAATSTKGAGAPTPTFSAPPPPPVTNTPPKADTTPPVVDVTSVSAFDVYYITGCGANTITVEAYVTDDSGVGSVNLIVSYIGSGSGGIFVSMTPIGGNIYRGTHDVGSQAYVMFGGVNGQVGLYVEAQDAFGNVAGEDGGTINVLYCPG